MSFGDFKFLPFRIARETQNLQTILQGRRNSVKHVRRSNKENLGEIILDIEVVILKSVVLFRVEHFQ